jgi:hypothetical protein
MNTKIYSVDFDGLSARSRQRVRRGSAHRVNRIGYEFNSIVRVSITSTHAERHSIFLPNLEQHWQGGCKINNDTESQMTGSRSEETTPALKHSCGRQLIFVLQFIKLIVTSHAIIKGTCVCTSIKSAIKRKHQLTESG